MELIYMYVKNFEDNIINQDINFSNSFEVKIEKNELVIKKKKINYINFMEII